MTSDDQPTSYFDLPKNVEERPEDYDGSRMLVSALSFLGILVLVPMAVIPYCLLLWAIMVFTLTFGVPAWQVWFVRCASCIFALTMVVWAAW